jgi:cyclopropane fatty-acyl-phospholipid synthase-like methyltransferase
VTPEPAGLVASGYDALGSEYLRWAAQIGGDPRLEWLVELTGQLSEGARILELGCGAGVPCTQLLAERFRVTGVDLSDGQLRLARARLPGVELIRADMTELDLPADTYDAVTAFYSVIHVPRREHALLFRRIRDWLRPGGLLLASLTAGDSPDAVEDDFVGVPMFFSGFDARTNRRLLEDAGLAVLREEVVTMREPEGDARFHWVLASRPHRGHQ